MKLRLLIILLSVTYTCFSQNAQHIKVPGTKCSLVPPTGFEPAAGFGGFHNQAIGASIVITEIPGPYEEVLSGFTADRLESKGIKMISRDSMRFNNFPASFFILRQKGGDGNIYQKLLLLFGNSSNTVMVNGIYPESEKSIEGTLKTSLLSTIYDQAANDDPLEAATFVLNVDGTEFKVAKYMMGTLLYTFDGKIPTDKPTLIAGSSISKTSIANNRQFAESRFRKMPEGNVSTIRETNNVVIDDMEGVEIIADFESGVLYQVMLFPDQEQYFLIVGQSKIEKDKYLKVYKQIAKTFHRK